ncbi:MAG: cobalt ECF transporter T component CbiQ [Gemmataceae bacterium]|nr:cobalt ECF transporter T component CbiQ [Gemmataceae bacterium]
MTSTLDVAAAPPSVLSRFDPRWKLAAFLFAAAATTLLQSPAPAASAFATALALATLARLPRRWCLTRLAFAALVAAPFVLLLPFTHVGEGPHWPLGPLTVSAQGLNAAGVVALKMLTLVLLMLVLLATGPMPDLFQAARRLHMPGPVVHVALLTHRYIFVLAGELTRIRLALRVRGYRNRMSLHCYRTAGHVAGTLLVRGYEQAERVGQAMRCRGFDGQFRTLSEFQTRTIDVLLFAASGVSAVLLVAWDFWQR